MRSDLRIVLGGLPLFHGLDEDILRDIAAEVEWLSVPGGAMLFATGEDSDAMYIVLSGCLGVFAEPDRKQHAGPRARGRHRGRDGPDLRAGPVGYGGGLTRQRARAPVARSIRSGLPGASRGDAANRATHGRAAGIRAVARPYAFARRTHFHDCPPEPRSGRRRVRERIRESAGALRPSRARLERSRRRTYQPLVPSHRERERFRRLCFRSKRDAVEQPLRAPGRCADAACARGWRSGCLGRPVQSSRWRHCHAARGASAPP